MKDVFQVIFNSHRYPVFVPFVSVLGSPSVEEGGEKFSGTSRLEGGNNSGVLPPTLFREFSL